MLHHNDIQLIEKIKELDYKNILNDADENQVPFLQHIFRLNLLIFNEVCNSCPTLVMTYIDKIKNYNTEMKEVTKSDYKLKNGSVIRLGGKPYSNHNLTNEVAEKFLKENENRKSLFIKMPSETTPEEVETVVIFETEFSTEVAKELLSKIGVNTKATTVFGVNKKVAELDEAQEQALLDLVHPKPTTGPIEENKTETTSEEE